MTLLSLLVNNHFGVLTRVTGLFSRRGYNITGLSVGETENPALSRITIQTETDDARQMCLQLQKLEDVHDVFPLPEGGTAAQELLLVKLRGRGGGWEWLDGVLEKFRCNALHKCEDVCILSFTGDPEEVLAFLSVLDKRDIAELCRTGIAAISTKII